MNRRWCYGPRAILKRATEEAWFRRRRPEEGTGYTAANGAGRIATRVFMALAPMSIAVPVAIGGGTMLSAIIAAALFLMLLIGFLKLVIVSTERRP